jgi:hypothetical protein
MPVIAPITRIRPATWFRHALSIQGLAEMLDTRARALDCGRDGRAPFARLRAAQMGRIAGLLESGGFGSAGAWIERLELEQTHHYLRASDSWDRGEPSLTTMPWRAIFAHERARDGDAEAALQAGTIAHLAYDLPLALARVGKTTTDGVDTAAAYARLSGIYVMTCDETVRAAMAGDRRAGHRGIAGAPITGAWHEELRSQAWDDAMSLIEGDEHAREVAFKRIELAAMCEIRRLMTGVR